MSGTRELLPPERYELRRGAVTHVEHDLAEFVSGTSDGKANHERNDRLHGRPGVIGDASQSQTREHRLRPVAKRRKVGLVTGGAP